MYTTLSTIEFCSLCNFFQVERGTSMWSSNFLVEAAVKFGVLLVVPRNEASPRNPASCLVPTCVFNAKKEKRKKNGRFNFVR